MIDSSHQNWLLSRHRWRKHSRSWEPIIMDHWVSDNIWVTDNVPGAAVTVWRQVEDCYRTTVRPLSSSSFSHRLCSRDGIIYVFPYSGHKQQADYSRSSASFSACWFFILFRVSVAPKSDTDGLHGSLFFTWSCLCVRMHSGFGPAHRQRVSATFLTQKNDSQVFPLCSWQGSNLASSNHKLSPATPRCTNLATPSPSSESRH